MFPRHRNSTDDGDGDDAMVRGIGRGAENIFEISLEKLEIA